MNPFTKLFLNSNDLQWKKLTDWDTQYSYQDFKKFKLKVKGTDFWWYYKVKQVSNGYGGDETVYERVIGTRFIGWLLLSGLFCAAFSLLMYYSGLGFNPIIIPVSIFLGKYFFSIINFRIFLKFRKIKSRIHAEERVENQARKVREREQKRLLRQSIDSEINYR